MRLEPEEQAMLAGEFGPAAARAMRLLLQYGRIMGADRLVPVVSAHIDGCLYHGPSSIDFAQSFVTLGGKVRVPTTLNVGAVDVVHPELHRGAADLIPAQRHLNALYAELGCAETLTCAPYQRIFRPAMGEHIAWAESNAIVFANSVLGARTDRYGDFTDLCAALTGRVPNAGLHRDENRRAGFTFEPPALAATGLSRDIYFAAIGYLIGSAADGRVPMIVGLEDGASEDELKALGASAASSGALALFHVAGVTPEAIHHYRDVEPPAGAEHIRAAADDLVAAVASLCPLEPGDPVAAMCLGTPHFSLAEFETLAPLIEGRRKSPAVEAYISTSREIAAAVEGGPLGAVLAAFGIQLVVDTCTYLAPVVASDGAIVTNSIKYAHYGPGNLDRQVGLLSMELCVRAAILGKVAP
ncbi:aconitase X catalytic domain-containing protein [Sphingopyxis sp. J-6]|uniref:aconitase X n=1 Tax=Sphingopyxis sp. J-6 TaxID=3122054 RepID=UPI0039842C55